MKIMFLNGAMTGQTMALIPSGTSIGRESDNTVQLPMGGVSRYHARIELDASGKWVIRDLGSTNGTLVDDMPVTGSAELVNGSVISIGDQLLRCIGADAPAAASSGMSMGNPPPFSPSPVSAPPPGPAPQQPNPQQPAFFFRPQNVSAKPATLSTAQIQGQGAARTQDSASSVSPSAPTVATVSTDVPKLFGRKGGGAKQQDRTKKILGNIIFALIVFLAAILGLGIWLFLSEDTAQPGQTKEDAKSKKTIFSRNTSSNANRNPSPSEKPTNPFFLYYEKEKLSGTDVFRFALLLEMRESAQRDNQAKSENAYYLEVTLDEPRNKRSYDESFKEPIPQELIDKLKQQIGESGFMELRQERIVGASLDNSDSKRIVVGYDDKFCEVTVSGDVSATFNRVEEIISNTLLEEYDLDVVNQPVETILADAEKFLFQAESEFAAIDLDPTNLREAIDHYRLALRRYELFDPKPAGWTSAGEGLKKAEEKLDSILRDGRTKVSMLKQQHRFSEAIEECDRLLKFFPSDSQTFKNIREEKLKLQDSISRRK